MVCNSCSLSVLTALMASSCLGLSHSGPATPKGERLPSSTVRQDSASGAPKAFLRGEAFPETEEYIAQIPTPSKTHHVSSGASLRQILCTLEPGERVVLARGTYRGRFEITQEKRCKDGTASRPIQIVGEQGAVIDGAFRAGRSHWQFIGLDVSPGRDSDLPAIMVESSNVLLERMHLHHGRFNGVVVTGRAQNVVISNSHIHAFDKRDSKGAPLDAHGVVVWAGASNVKLIANEIHHNSGDGVQVNGPGDGSIPEDGLAKNVEIIGNRFHDDVENAVDIKDARNVVIRANQMWNYTPAPRANGAAIVVQYDAANVRIERNHILNSHGIFVGRGTVGPSKRRAAHKPRGISIQDNYLENTSPKGVGLEVMGAECVTFYHNVVRNFRGGIAVRVGKSDASKVRIANNLFLDISTLGFWLTSDYRDVVAQFDYNAFASREGDVRVQIGGAQAEAAKNVFLLRNHSGPGRRMPHTIVAGEVDVAGNDLARITGISTDRMGAPGELVFCDGAEIPPPGAARPSLGVR